MSKLHILRKNILNLDHFSLDAQSKLKKKTKTVLGLISYLLIIAIKKILDL